jgi:xanthine/uracil permease
MLNLLYGLNEKMPFKQEVIYALQHLIFFLASAIVLPVVVGRALGLSQEGVAEMLQRTFLLCGVITSLQIFFGHRYPIYDSPAGLWSGMLILMTGAASELGKGLPLLRTDLETGILISAAFVVLLSLLGLMPKLINIFTPTVNGVILILMVLQLSPNFVRGMVGIHTGNTILNPKSLMVFLVTVGLILFVNTYTKGFLQSISTLIGTIAGWILAAALGLVSGRDMSFTPVISLPSMFAWGTPTFDMGVTLTCILAGLVLISMDYTSINGLAETLGEKLAPERFSRSILIHGIGNSLASIFSTIPYMPYLSSSGILLMTRVATKKPLLLASYAMAVLGLIKPIGVMFATIPTEVGYAALIMIFALIFGQGIRELQKVKIENRESFIIGVSALIGIGVMFLPADTFREFPQAARYILSNGLVDGTLIVILMEHVILRKGKV